MGCGHNGSFKGLAGAHPISWQLRLTANPSADQLGGKENVVCQHRVIENHVALCGGGSPWPFFSASGHSIQNISRCCQLNARGVVEIAAQSALNQFSISRMRSAKAALCCGTVSSL